MSAFIKQALPRPSRAFPLLLALMMACEPAIAETSCKTLTVSGNPEYPPLLWEKPFQPDHLTGAATALLGEILEPLDVSLEVEGPGSWARVQRLARVGELDMIAGAFITSERIQFLDYLLPPFIHLPAAVWVPEGQAFEYRHWPDLKGKKGSTLISNSFGEGFDQYAKENLEIVNVRTIEQSFEMALAGRVDYVLYERLQGQVKLERLGLADKFVAMDVPVSNEGLFFAFSKNSQCNTFEFRERIADRLYTLINSGRFDELIDEYTARYMSLRP